MVSCVSVTCDTYGGNELFFHSPYSCGSAINSCSTFFSVIQAALPEGVQLMINSRELEDEELCYVPDFELRQLKEELELLGGPSEQSKRENRRFLLSSKL